MLSSNFPNLTKSEYSSLGTESPDIYMIPNSVPTLESYWSMREIVSCDWSVAILWPMRSHHFQRRYRIAIIENSSLFIEIENETRCRLYSVKDFFCWTFAFIYGLKRFLENSVASNCLTKLSYKIQGWCSYFQTKNTLFTNNEHLHYSPRYASRTLDCSKKCSTCVSMCSLDLFMPI